MGEKMKQGGTVVRSKVSHMPNDAPNVAANLEEYITIVSAGLAGSTPHMISASVTALTRILYHFHSKFRPFCLGPTY
jgi:ribosomal RNA-processing protein 12